MVIRLFLGIWLFMRHVPSEKNQADGPSRGYPVGAAPETIKKAQVRQFAFGQG